MACNRLPLMGKLARVRERELLCNRFMVAQEATGLNKKDFGAAVGASPQTMSMIKAYSRQPSREVVQAAIREFGFTAEWFYLGQRGGIQDRELAEKLREAERRLNLTTSA